MTDPSRPTPEPPDLIEMCPACERVGHLNSPTAKIRCCLVCGADVTPIMYRRHKPTPEPTDVERLIADGERCRPHDPAHRTNCACVHCLAAALAAALRTAQTREQQIRADGWCDACCGTGKPTSGKPCMCGGSGLASMAVIYLRGQLLKAEQKQDVLRDQLQVVEHQRDVANQYVQMREDEIATLRDQLQQARERDEELEACARIVTEARDAIDLNENDVPRQQCIMRLSVKQLGNLNRLLALLSPTGGD